MENKSTAKNQSDDDFFTKKQMAVALISVLLFIGLVAFISIAGNQQSKSEQEDFDYIEGNPDKITRCGIESLYFEYDIPLFDKELEYADFWHVQGIEDKLCPNTLKWYGRDKCMYEMQNIQRSIDYPSGLDIQRTAKICIDKGYIKYENIYKMLPAFKITTSKEAIAIEQENLLVKIKLSQDKDITLKSHKYSLGSDFEYSIIHIFTNDQYRFYVKQNDYAQLDKLKAAL